MVSRQTYRGAGVTRVNVNITHVRVNVTRNFDHHPDPLVQGVGGEVIFGGAHGVVTPRVLVHQVGL
jgi:hypothetical protein